MGEVRSALADPQTSPIKKAQDLREQIYDLIQIKRKDLASEGAAAAPRNQASIDALQRAVTAVTDCETILRTY